MLDAAPARPTENGAARVLAVFRYLGSVPDGATLGEITAALRSPKTSVHRALGTLRTAGLVSQDPAGRYRYSHDLFRLVFGCYEGVDEAARVRPVLDLLAQRFAEATHYAILDGSEIVYVAKVQAPRSGMRITSVVGGRNPAHCTGVGKALLAFTHSTEAALSAFVATYGPLAARTPNTIVTFDDLAIELALTRERGYAIDREESEVGIACVAIPIFLGSNEVPAGAISVTALARRMSPADLEQAVPEIRHVIEGALGGVLA
ncbi:MAG: IclR family transcriptional regulator [Acidimicrobiales bacterium]